MILTSMGDDINIDDIIFISKQTLYKHYMLMGIILIIVIALLCYLFISNSRFHLKKLGYHTYIDLYKEIRLLRRKYKKIPILVFMNDKYYQCYYKTTAGGRLVIVPDKVIDISIVDLKEKDKDVEEKTEAEKDLNEVKEEKHEAGDTGKDS